MTVPAAGRLPAPRPTADRIPPPPGGPADPAPRPKKGAETAAPRPCLAQDWWRLMKIGAVAAVGQVFIALSNMPVRFDERVVVEPVFSMGYLALLVLPFAAGHRQGRQIRRAGVAVHSPGAHEVVGGAVCGAVAGGGLSLLAVLLANFDLRDPLVNWSPMLLDLLSFGTGSTSLGQHHLVVDSTTWSEVVVPWFAVLVWLAVGAGAGAAGGGLRVLGPVTRHAVVTMALAVVGSAVLETLVVDLAEGMRLEWFTDRLYARRGGVAWMGAVVLAAASGVLAAVLAALGRGRLRQARARIDAKQGAERTRTHALLIAATGAALVILPLFAGKLTNELLANVGLFVLLALGLNVVVGLAGILDLGYVAFFAVGSYSAAVLTAATSPRINPELPWLVALVAVVVITGLVGLFIGAPVIRMRGDYLAIVTLGFGEIIRLLFLSDWLSGWFGGSQGITKVPGAGIFGLTEVAGTDPRRVFYLVLAFCALAIYVSWRLERSRLGRAWMAVREDETVAEAMGINTVNVKLMAFVVGAVLGSFSGAIFSAKVGSVFPNSFLILVSIVILVVVIFGGMGNIVGVIAGSVVLIGVLGGPKQPGLLAEFSEFKLLIYGALLVWMMLARPEGLIPSVRRSRELHQQELAQDAWLRGQADDDSPTNNHPSATPSGAAGAGSGGDVSAEAT